MKKHYDFNAQISIMGELFQSNIYFAENANTFLKNMPQSLIRRAVKELKEEYEEEYLKQDDEKLNSINSTLNLVAKQQVTNVDELFMQLGFEINAYYGTKYLDLTKQLPYYNQCSFCKRKVSNYTFGIKCHLAKCSQNHDAKKSSQSTKKRRIVDNQERYQSRQKSVSVPEQDSEKAFPPSKKQQLTAKKSRKEQESSRSARKTRAKGQQAQTYDGWLNFDHFDRNMCLFEDMVNQPTKMVQQILKTQKKSFRTMAESDESPENSEEFLGECHSHMQVNEYLSSE